MPFDPNDKFHKELCVHFAFRSNYSPEHALWFVQNSFPFVTLDEINNFYESFRNAIKIDLHGEPEHTDESSDDGPSAKRPNLNSESSSDAGATGRASLSGLPAEMLEHILLKSTTEDQKSLHKTSHGLSNFLLTFYKSYEEVEVFITNTVIRMRLAEQKGAVTRNVPGEKRKLDGDNVKRVQNSIESFATIPEAINSLESVLMNPKIKIGLLRIHCEKSNVEHRRLEYYAGLRTVLNKLKSPLHVEKLNIVVSSAEELIPVLRKLRVGPLKDIELSNGCIPRDVFRSEEIERSSHWPNIVRFHSAEHQMTISLEKLMHIPHVFLKTINATIENIVAHKNRLLKIPNKWNQIFIMDTNGLEEALQPFTPSNNLAEKEGFFNCDYKKKLRFTIISGCIGFDMH